MFLKPFHCTYIQSAAGAGRASGRTLLKVSSVPPATPNPEAFPPLVCCANKLDKTNDQVAMFELKTLFIYLKARGGGTSENIDTQQSYVSTHLQETHGSYPEPCQMFQQLLSARGSQDYRRFCQGFGSAPPRPQGSVSKQCCSTVGTGASAFSLCRSQGLIYSAEL